MVKAYQDIIYFILNVLFIFTHSEHTTVGDFSYEMIVIGFSKAIDWIIVMFSMIYRSWSLWL